VQNNAEVEDLRESERGWCLVRTLVGRLLISCKMFRACDKIWTIQRRQNFRVKTDFLEVVPIGQPKPPRVLKMAQDVCIGRSFWHSIQKGKDSKAPITETSLSAFKTNIKRKDLASSIGESNCTNCYLCNA